MIDATSLLKNLTARGIRLTPDPPKLIAEPSSLLTQDDRELIRSLKAQLLTLLEPALAIDAKPTSTPADTDDPAGAALSLLERLRGYSLPAGRMPAARAMVERLRPLLGGPELDPAASLAALKALEAELTASGGHYDPELADLIGLLDAFPGSQLVNIKKLLQ